MAALHPGDLNDDFTSFAPRVLDPHDAVRARWNRRAGHDSHRFARTDGRNGTAAGRGSARHAKPGGYTVQIGVANRIPVHRRVGVAGDIALRVDVLAEDTTDTFEQASSLGVERSDGADDLI